MLGGGGRELRRCGSQPHILGELQGFGEFEEAQWALAPWPPLPMLGEGEENVVGAARSRTSSVNRKSLGESRKRSYELRLRIAGFICEIPSSFLEGLILRENFT